MLDRDQFAGLVRMHSNDLFNYACHMLRNRDDAGDVVQEVFMRCWQNRERIQPGHEKNWLLRVACRRCLDQLRRRQRTFKRFRYLEVEELEQLPGSLPAQDTLYDTHERQRLLQQALAELTDRARSIMLLHYFHGFDYQEIAVLMEMRPSAVRTTAHRARKMLHRKLRSIQGTDEIVLERNSR